MSVSTRTRIRTTATYPIIEIFGRTIQGEGPQAGAQCCFVRLGGCDYRCGWCDSLYAVEPELVRRGAQRMSAPAIVGKLEKLWPQAARTARLAILSGGNPALHELGGLVELLHDDEWHVSVETQGSVWRPWLKRADTLVVSPKPPSSGMASKVHCEAFYAFCRRLARTQGPDVALKIVCFDERDLDWAFATRRDVETILGHTMRLYLSVGTPQRPNATLGEVARRLRWLFEALTARPDEGDFVALPQLHVLAWGHERGR